MDFTIQNVGVIENSTIKLDGLTIITGANNSGKSTAGKALYSTIEGMLKLSQKRDDELIYVFRMLLFEISNALRLSTIVKFIDFNRVNTIDKSKYFFMLLGSFPTMEMEIKEINEFKCYLEQLNKGEIVSFISEGKAENKNVVAYLENFEEAKQKALKIFDRLDVYLKDNDISSYAKISLISQFKREFRNQIYPIGLDSIDKKCKICLKKNDEVGCDFIIKSDNEIIGTNNTLKNVFYNDVVFIDNAYVIDGVKSDAVFMRPYSRVFYNHNEKLFSLLKENSTPSFIVQTMNDRQYDEIVKQMDSIVSGDIVEKDGALYYLENNRNTPLRVENLATGSKVFSIIKSLLKKGKLGLNTMLILDEPEAHLHPEWQNKFAEIIVLLVKELDINVLLTTHSINFVLAIDTYVKKYELNKKANFYKTKFVDRDNPYLVNYINTTDNLDNLYVEFVKPFSKIKAENAKFDEED